jgi:membrane associated rhomboid family serine protease
VTEGDDETMTAVGRWPTLDEAQEHALVVLAMNRDCRLSALGETGRAYQLEVVPEAVPEVRRELELYAAECEEAAAAPKPGEIPEFPAGLGVAALWALVLWMVFVRQARDPGLVERFANSAQGVWRDGEWWRSFTALFLHADLEHLMGNILIGGVFCLLVAVSFGPWRGWLLILACGFIGNLINAKLHQPGPFFSIGASTATFGALGLVIGHGLRHAWENRQFRELRLLLGPFGAGACLFGWFGVGGVDTDVSAHLLGTATGIVLGWFVARWIFAFESGRQSALRVEMGR